MSHPIAGVTPPELAEAPLITAWPTLGAHPLGRWVGQLCSAKGGFGPFTIGNFFALATIPVSLAVFFWQLLPFLCRRYAVTTRRIIIRRGLSAVEDKWINLDEFDQVAIEVLPGQAWLRSGDISFRRDGAELMRLSGVSRPEVFRHACLKAQTALVSVAKVVRQQAAAAAARSQAPVAEPA